MYQQITIIGRLGKDPDLRYTPGGTPVCNFSVATDRVWNDGNGERQEETTWHNVTVWRNQAEACAKYLTKASLVMVTGNVKARGWTNRDGNIGASLEVNADIVRFLSTRSDSQQSQQPQGDSSPVKEEDIPF